jgi:hypothetical protein
LVFQKEKAEAKLAQMDIGREDTLDLSEVVKLMNEEEVRQILLAELEKKTLLALDQSYDNIREANKEEKENYEKLTNLGQEEREVGGEKKNLFLVLGKSIRKSTTEGDKIILELEFPLTIQGKGVSKVRIQNSPQLVGKTKGEFIILQEVNWGEINEATATGDITNFTSLEFPTLDNLEANGFLGEEEELTSSNDNDYFLFMVNRDNRYLIVNERPFERRTFTRPRDREAPQQREDREEYERTTKIKEDLGLIIERDGEEFEAT